MTNAVRLSLPTYNALSDTNLDHYSLYTDVDNVLIKRASSGSGTVPVAGGSGYTTTTIAHNLGYVPFFAVYARYTDLMGDTWKLLNNRNSFFSVPEAIAEADTTNLYITNFQGVTLDYAYDIFYDDMSQTGTPQITESQNVFKVARPGKSAASKNPNDYIVHSDLNSLKILKQATVNKTLAAGDNTIAHGMSLTTPYKIIAFVKFPDGKTLLTGNAPGYSYDETKWLSISMDATNIHIYSSGAYTVDVIYIIFGTAQAGSVASIESKTLGPVIAIASPTYNVKSETNIENFTFHSHFPTLKYDTSGTWDMGTITATTVKTIAHNLGYVPFFIGFINDVFQFKVGAFCIAPFYQGGNIANSDIASYVYADSTNIYLKGYYQSAASGTTLMTFYYKIFKNNLGL